MEEQNYLNEEQEGQIMSAEDYKVLLENSLITDLEKGNIGMATFYKKNKLDILKNNEASVEEIEKIKTELKSNKERLIEIVNLCEGLFIADINSSQNKKGFHVLKVGTSEFINNPISANHCVAINFLKEEIWIFDTFSKNILNKKKEFKQYNDYVAKIKSLYPSKKIYIFDFGFSQKASKGCADFSNLLSKELKGEETPLGLIEQKTTSVPSNSSESLSYYPVKFENFAQTSQKKMLSVFKQESTKKLFMSEIGYKLNEVIIEKNLPLTNKDQCEQNQELKTIIESFFNNTQEKEIILSSIIGFNNFLSNCEKLVNTSKSVTNNEDFKPIEKQTIRSTQTDTKTDTKTDIQADIQADAKTNTNTQADAQTGIQAANTFVDTLNNSGATANYGNIQGL